MALLACFTVLTIMGGLARAEEANEAQEFATTQGTIERIADASTADDYKDILGTADDGGRYTGRVWTDKSVYTDASMAPSLPGDSSLPGGSSVTNDADFLTVYSALGSTRVINGQATTPLDVVLMLDVSTSMSTEGQGTQIHVIDETILEANRLIDQLMRLNDYNRVGVVAYSGGTATILELGHYTPRTTVDGVGQYLLLDTNRASGTHDNKKWWNRLMPNVEEVANPQWSPYLFADSTYLQGALYEGMKLLATEKDTEFKDGSVAVSRIPAIVVLSDGATNTMTKSSTPNAIGSQNNWWYPITGVMPTQAESGNAHFWPLQNGNPVYSALSPSYSYTLTSIVPRTLATLMTGGYMKKAVENNYGVEMQGYSIGLNVNGLNAYEIQQLLGTLNPKEYFVDDGKGYAQLASAYTLFQKYLEGTQAQAIKYSGSAYDLVSHTREFEDTYYLDHLPSGPIGDGTISGVTDFESVDDLYYIDHYYEASTDTIGDIFDNILSQLGGLAFHPVSSGGAGGAEGGITYVDPIGEYMEIKDFKALTIFGQTYYVVKDGDEYRVSTDPNTFVDAEVLNPDYINRTTFKLSDITIEIQAAANANTPGVDLQKLVVKLPEAALPLRKETIDLNAELDAAGHQTVRSYASNADTAFPLRLYYTVGVSDAIKLTDPMDASKVLDQIDLSKVSATYRAEHTNADGSVDFFSNLYTGEVGETSGQSATVGNATVKFSPDASNRYYYFQKNRVIYESGDEGVVGNGGRVDTPVTGSLNPEDTYYFVIDYYMGTTTDGSYTGGSYVEYVVKRTGEELQNSFTYIDPLAANQYYANTAVDEYPQGGDGRVMATQRGSVRLGHLDRFAQIKDDDGNATHTAASAYFPTYNSASGATGFVVYLGNNGRLRVTDTAVQVSKMVQSATDSNGNSFDYGDEPTFTYTIQFQGMANRTVEAIEYIYSEGIDSTTGAALSHWVPAPAQDDGTGFKTQTFTLDDEGKTTFTLQNKQALRFTSLPPNTLYTVVEDEAIEGVSEEMSSVLGEPDPDGYFYFDSLTGTGTVVEEDRAISSTTQEGVVTQASYVNGFTKTVEFISPQVSIYKELEGRPFDPADTFQFVMRPATTGTPEHTPLPNGATGSNASYTMILGPNIEGEEQASDGETYYRSKTPLVCIGGNEGDPSITFNQPGTYIYEITEVRPTGGASLAGITYDTTMYRLTVEVAIENNELLAQLASVERVPSGEGAPEVLWTPESQSEPALTFRNRFNTDEVSPEFWGRKVLDGREIEAGQFSYVLEAAGSHAVTRDETYDILKDDSDMGPADKIAYIEENVDEWVTDEDAPQPMPAGSQDLRCEASNDADGRISFGSVTFSRALPLTSDQDTKLRGIIYKYQVTEKQPTVDGTFNGDPLPGGALPNGQSYEAAQKTGDGRWYYQGVVYDPSVKTFYVWAHLDDYVDEEGNPGTIVHATILGDMPFSREAGRNYANEYRTQNELELLGTKSIEGREFQDADAEAGRPADSFTFQVEGVRMEGSTGAVTVAPMPSGLDAQGRVTITPTEGSEAAISFGVISLTNADAGNSYRYTITEVSGTLGGMTYDTQPRVITVTVVDDGYGNLLYTVEIDGNDVTSSTAVGNAQSIADWTNTYRPASVSTHLEGVKTLIGKPLYQGEFSFQTVQVQDENGEPLENGPVWTSTNVGAVEGVDSAGVSLLPEVTYDQVGDFYYLITEMSRAADDPAVAIEGTQQIVTYDSARYLLRVQVTDDLMGHLQAYRTLWKWENNAWVPSPQGALFTNTYHGVAMQVLDLTKQVLGNGDAAAAGSYEFILSARPQGTSPTEGVQLPETTVVAADANGTVHFDPVLFTQEGTYELRVIEKQPTDTGLFDGNPNEGAVLVDTNDDGVGDRWLCNGVLYDNHAAVSIVVVTRDPATGALKAERTQVPTTRVFTNDYGITIGKTIAYPEGMNPTDSEQTADAQVPFTFDVALFQTGETGMPEKVPVGGAYTLVRSADGGVSYAGEEPIEFDQATGIATVTLTAGERVRILGVPQGVSYRITERPATGWSQTVPEDQGAVSGVVNPGTDALAFFTNTKHIPEPKKDVALSADPTTSIDGVAVGVGDVLRYVVSWTNETGANAEDVSITDAAPAGTAAHYGDDGQVVCGIIQGPEGSTWDFSPEDAAFSWSFGTVAPGETVVAYFDVEVSGDAVHRLDNQATLHIGPNGYDTNWVHNPIPGPVKDVTTVEDPSISIDGEAVRVGDVLRYEIAWTNNTELTAEDVVITDWAPTGTVYEDPASEDSAAGNPTGEVVATEAAEGREIVGVHQDTVDEHGAAVGDAIVWNVGTVEPGQTVRVSFQVVVAESAVTRVDNQAYMTVGPSGPIVTNEVRNPIPDPEKHVTTPMDPTISIDGRGVTVGDVLRYQIDWTNTSGAAVENVVITDHAPEGTAYIESERGLGAPEGGVFNGRDAWNAEGERVGDVVVAAPGDNASDVVWSAARVEAGQTLSVSFQVVVTESAVKRIENTASMTVGSSAPIITNEVRNPVPDPVKDVTTAADPSTSINGQSVKMGDVLRYEITWTNNTGMAVENVAITDAAPAGTTYVDHADNPGNPQGGIYDDAAAMVRPVGGAHKVIDEVDALVWQAGTVEPGQTVKVSFQVVVDESAVICIDNTASMTVGNSAPIITNEVRNPIPDPVKDVFYAQTPTASIDGQVVAVGDTLRYEVAWTNTTGVDVQDVCVVDAAPEGTTYYLDANGLPVNAGSIQGAEGELVRDDIAASLGADGRLTWSVGVVKANETVVVTFDVTVSASAVQQIDNQASLFVGPNEHLTNWVHNTVPAPAKDVTTVEDPSISIDGATVHVGDILRYEVAWTNDSALTAEDVCVIDAAPAGTEYVLADDGQPVSDGGIYTADGQLIDGSSVRAELGDDGRLVWYLGTVEPSCTVRVSFQVRVASTSITTVDNQAILAVGPTNHETNWVHNPVEFIEGSDSVVLELTKTLYGRAMEEGEFGFVATDVATGEEMAAMVTAGADGQTVGVSFKPLVYTTGTAMLDAEEQPDGTLIKRFVYAISEVNGGLDGILYDPTVFYAVVTVTDDQRGNLVASDPAYFYDAEGAYPVDGVPAFVNRYSAELPFVPSAFKTTEVPEGKDASALAFGFVVTDNNGGAAQGQIVSVGTAPANGPVSFNTMEFSAAGTYRYLLSELRGGTGDALVYDDASYAMEVVVEAEQDGGLHVASVLYRDVQGNVLDGAPVFHNVYDGDLVALNLNLAKALKDGQGASLPLANGQFAFVLTNADTGEQVAIGYNDANGNVVLSTLTYSYRTVEPEVTPEEESPAPEEETPSDTDEPAPDATEPTEQPGEFDAPGVDNKPGVEGEPAPGDDGTIEAPQEPAVPEVPAEPEPNPEPEPEPELDEGATAPESLLDAMAVLDLLAPTEAIADAEGDPYVSAYAEEAPVVEAPEANPVGGEEPGVLEATTPAASTTPQVESSDLGEHHYILREVVPPQATQLADGSWVLDGVTYDRDAYYITVTVSDNGDGTISAQVTAIELWVRGDAANAKPLTLGQPNPLEYVVFENVRNASDPLRITLEGDKTLAGRDAVAGEFDFVVRDANGAPVSVGTTVQDASADQAAPIRFSVFEVPAVPGSYEYTVAEMQGDDPSITYSNQLFRAVVTVAHNDDGVLQAIVDYPDGRPAFVNTYNPEPVAVALNATKTLSGRDLVADEFAFTVKDGATGEIVASASNKVDGSVNFPMLTFSEEGVYEYQIAEVVGREDGMTYDSAVYRAIVTVEKTPEGTLSASVSYPDGSPVFANTYTPPVPPATPENPPSPSEPESPTPPSTPATPVTPNPQVPATGDAAPGVATAVVVGLLALLAGAAWLLRGRLQGRSF